MRKNKESLAAFLFHQGTNYHTFEYLGVHRSGKNYVFRVWAPNALNVFVAGEFNGWSESDPMTRVTEGGVWETKLPEVRIAEGQLYKFRLRTEHGDLFKADPYGTRTELPPGTASVIHTASSYVWHDASWLRYRKKQTYDRPLNIYELHLGSWKRNSDGSLMNYRQIADELAPYVKMMGYTHIELMPVTEFPFDGSWGYQVCGYYAPTARFGTPEDFKAFIDRLHGAGIGVILDWVPAHFPKDAHGLYEFDGKPLYEYQGADRIEHAGWGTRRFDVGRNEVECFLISDAVWWAEEYHADGLRVDAVASMIYLDYDRKPGEWIPNIYGDNRCLEAHAFFKKLNGYLKKEIPELLMIAEESGSGVKITGFDHDGLGFDMKWDMGWMNDTLSYAALDPVYRKYHHNQLTFSMMYAFGERYVLPISHDEVVHGKKSFLDRMPGSYEDKFAGSRLFGAYMMTHPGKKLTFMGSEIGQFREWDYAGQIEWFLLDYEMHAKLQFYYASLNQFYLSHRALWENDSDWEGFQWIDADNRDESVLSCRRIARNGDELVVLLNFTPVRRENFTVRVPEPGSYRRLFCSDETCFGGWGNIGDETYETHFRPDGTAVLHVLLPPTGVLILGYAGETERSQPDTEK